MIRSILLLCQVVTMKANILSRNMKHSVFFFLHLLTSSYLLFLLSRWELGHFDSKCTSHKWVKAFPFWALNNLSNFSIKELPPKIWFLQPLSVSLKLVRIGPFPGAHPARLATNKWRKIADIPYLHWDLLFLGIRCFLIINSSISLATELFLLCNIYIFSHSVSMKN